MIHASTPLQFQTAKQEYGFFSRFLSSPIIVEESRRNLTEQKTNKAEIWLKSSSFVDHILGVQLECVLPPRR